MSEGQPADTSEQFRSAEDWLAQRGITRDTIDVAPASPAPESSGGEASDHAVPPPSAREAALLATEQPPAAPGTADAGADDNADPDDQVEPVSTPRGDLSDEVAKALAFIQRSTARHPASTGRLRRKLRERDTPTPAIKLALQDAEERGLVDDDAFAAALVDEARAKGHAPRRIAADLRTREFDRPVIDAALARHNDRDPEAVAFDVAQRKAASYRDLDAEKAFRRLVGHLARRGHNEHLARKVARQVVFDDRESDRVAGH